MKRIGMGEMMKLCHLLVMKTYQKGAYIHDMGQPDETVYFIKKGQVKIGHRDEAGNETLRYVLGQGHIFGESRIMGEPNSGYFAKVLSETQICLIEADMMEQLLGKYPRLNNAITRISWKKVSKMERRLEDLLYKDAKMRILDFLKDHVRENSKEEEEGLLIAKNPFSHTDIAKLTSTSRQTVNNVISANREPGIFEYDRYEIRLKADHG